MPSLVRQSLLMPLWLAQVFTREKWSVAPLGLRQPIFYWKSVDLLESVGLGRQHRRAHGNLSAFDPA
jgi:hypothetical protein